MKNEFSNIMAEKTDQELITIVTTDKTSYQPLAILAAEKEIESRHIDAKEFKKQEAELIVDQEKEEKLASRKVSITLRLVNFLIDSFLIIMVSNFFLNIYDMLMIVSEEIHLKRILYAIYFSVFFLYYLIFEGISQRTIGKYITKTKVVKANGEKLNFSDILVRTFCRFIPFDSLSYIFVNNGIHDYLSKTTIVKNSFRPKPESTVIDDIREDNEANKLN